MIKSAEKRPVPVETLEKATDEIETELNHMNVKEVSSIRIGDMVMDKLKSIDQVTYIRFASVYREFKDVKSFKEELDNLKEE